MSDRRTRAPSRPARGAPRPLAPKKIRPPPIGTVTVPGLAKPHPEIGLGLWNRGRWDREMEARVGPTVDRALEKGITWLDTAEVYGGGRSERILGAALGDHEALVPRLFLVTKVSWEHLRPPQIRAAIQGSLERLGRTKVDLYLVHAPDERVPIDQTMTTLGEILDEGRIDAIGVSNFSVNQLDAAQSALGPRHIGVNQVNYNLIEREEGDALQRYCRDHGVLLEAYSPLCHGLLAGRFLKEGAIPPSARRGVPAFGSDRVDRTIAKARELEALATAAKVPLASIALHWLRRKNAVPLFGASRPHQVDENLQAWDARPSTAVLESADAITAEGHA